MKKTLCFILLLSLLYACTSGSGQSEQNQENALSHYELPENTITQLKFGPTHVHAANIINGQNVEYRFPVTNVGERPLIINNVKSSCGCVVPSWTKTPVLPGETTYLKALFNTTHKPGKQTKSITMTANTEPVNHIFRLSAEVLDSIPDYTKGKVITY